MEPKIVLNKLEGYFPSFTHHWNRTENYSKKIDGSFTYCGLFSEFLAFISRFSNKIEENEFSEGLADIFYWIEELLNSNKPDEINLVNALKLCFLEKIMEKSWINQITMGESTVQFLQGWDREG